MVDDRVTRRLVLGTAQLGMPYGVANVRGQPSSGEASALLDFAVAEGISRFDTAAGYGEAESLLGLYIKTRLPEQRPDVVTKLIVGDIDDERALRVAVEESVERLGVQPAALLLHDPTLLASWRGSLSRVLESCKEDGLVRAIGASVYHPEQFSMALTLPGLDIVQAPFNVFDRRLEMKGLLEQAHSRGIDVMLRSVFLQGLLLMDADRYPSRLRPVVAPLGRWRSVCALYDVDPLTAALRFVMERAPLATVVVGCESKTQLGELIIAARGPDLPIAFVRELEEMATSDRDLIDPTRWPS
jgi:aryl-alcohol dehydrogenase-like predicted oxidoreductase